MEKNPVLRYNDLDRVDFREFLNHQSLLASLRSKDIIPDTVITCRLLPCYSVTKDDFREDFKDGARDKIYRAGKYWYYNKIPVYRVERGGSATYHDEGQLTIVPVFKIGSKAVEWALGAFFLPLATAICRRLGIDAEPISYQRGHKGIAAGTNKLYVGHIGASLTGGVSRFGMSLNIKANLDNFNAIYPCGLKNPDITVGNLNEIKKDLPEYEELVKITREEVWELIKEK